MSGRGKKRSMEKSVMEMEDLKAQITRLMAEIQKLKDNNRKQQEVWVLLVSIPNLDAY